MSNVIDLVMPKFGLTMEEGLVSQWLIEPGSTFKKGEPVVVIETDKIANEYEAPEAGRLHKIIVAEGDSATVGQPIALWDIGKTGVSSIQDARSGDESSSGKNEVSESETAVSHALPQQIADVRIIATPLARRIAKQNDVQLNSLSGSGPGGRIKAEDVRRHMLPENQDLTLYNPEFLKYSNDVASNNSGSRRKATGYETAAAKRLVAAKNEMPHFYLSTEVDVGNLLEIRKHINDSNEGRARVSVNHLLIAAMARALMDVPRANSIWDQGEIVQFSRADVGVAVNTDRGLFVPILKDVASQGVLGVASQAAKLVELTREGKLSPDDTRGGATTVSNAGMFDVTHMSSIINPGQSSILGVGSIREVFRPDAEGRPSLKREMGVVLSCDHRVLDGVSGLQFLNQIKHYLETPFKLIVH